MKSTVDQFKVLNKNVFIRRVVVEEDINTLFQQKGQAGLIQLIEQGETLLEEVEAVSVTNVALPNNWEKQSSEFLEDVLNTNTSLPAIEKNLNGLTVLHENKLQFSSTLNNYFVLGSLPQDLSSLRVTLMIEEIARGRKERVKIDLYEREMLKLFCAELADLFNQDVLLIESDLLLLTDHLEKYREKLFEMAKPAYQSKRHSSVISSADSKKCTEFLSSPGLISSIDALIKTSGVVGESSTRKLLFVIASTYKMGTPLHSLVQGSSGSGKSHLINSIAGCFPPEDVISMTRVTSKSFYHYSKDDLVDKLILIQDYDGLDEEAQYAFRELQSAGNISSSTTYKDRSGNLVSAVKVVKSHFASLLATTKADIYYDNMSRSIVLGVDESDEQTFKIIEYQNKKLSGVIDAREEQKARLFLQNCMRLIKPLEVVNPYAERIKLPEQAKMLRRLNNHYQSFVKQITLLHQYQRKRDSLGRLITEIEDLQIASDILFDAIMLKVDELDSSLRHFFDRLKVFIQKQANGKLTEFQFTQREIRLALNVSKSQCFRFMEDLELLEYVQRTGGYANRGFKYRIVFWDDMDKIREKIKKELIDQLALLVPSGSADLEHHKPQQQRK